MAIAICCSPLVRQKPPVQEGGERGGAEDAPECRAGYYSWHPGELRMKLLNLRPHDRDVAAELRAALGRSALASEPYAR